MLFCTYRYFTTSDGYKYRVPVYADNLMNDGVTPRVSIYPKITTESEPEKVAFPWLYAIRTVALIAAVDGLIIWYFLK
jgi:hypothetical protein